MSLTTALFNAKSGLASTQRQVAGTSNNIANARTPGYVAQEARITANNTAGIGSGVSASVVRSPVDSILLRDVRAEAGKLSLIDVRAGAIQQLAQVSGDPGDERSVASSLTKLETAFQRLYDSPERPELQREVFFAARDLTDKFAAAQDAIKTSREAADREIAVGVATVNDALSSIADLNLKIAEGLGNPDIEVSGIMDERDRLIDVVAEQIGIRTFTRDRGEVVITTTEGVTLLDGTPREITFTRTTSIDASTRIDATPSLLSGLEVDGFGIEPGPLAGPQALRSGAIAGHFLARDVDLITYQEQLDALAKEVVVLFQQSDAQVAALRYGAFNGGPEAPVDVPGLFTDLGNGVDPTATDADIIGLASRLRVNDLVNPDAPGGDLTRLRTGIVATFRDDAATLDFSTFPPTVGGPAYDNPGSPTFDGYTDQLEKFLTGLAAPRPFAPNGGLTSETSLQAFASEFASGIQTDRANLEVLSERSRVIFDTLEIRRQNENGVNVDEESEKLLELEQAYAANAQVINVIARMFDELLARVA
ncbi:flagellar hook-associated protein FlgK [Parvularcula maris]|uniref:Flagellar hook-associated protein 1 n=1 Tax=Parvularcula maris TaxID=2965077 RepID=A0A9X2L9C2_9PROT|nr:flagellar hook-associated protein FlgK [Parvularcula maris]MCQ8185510.1 flagellar hook-associated protein FlgK [Parvularcula maris]